MRKRYDHISKTALTTLLAGKGTVLIERRTTAEPQSIDALFERKAPPDNEPGIAGLLARETALFEPFHQAPRRAAVRACLMKQFTLEAERRRKRVGAKKPPLLWILSAGMPRKVIAWFHFRRMKRAPLGVWTAPRSLRMRLVVISELDRCRETLLLRLMGAGRTLHDALEDLRHLPETAPERKAMLPTLAQSGMELKMQPGKRTQAEEKRMNDVQWAFDELLRKTAEEGKGEGVKRQFEHRLGRKLIVREDKTLRDRLSTLGADRLGIVVLDLSAVELARWLKDPTAQ